MTVFSYTF